LFCDGQPEFLRKAVKKWSTDESYVKLMEVIAFLRSLKWGPIGRNSIVKNLKTLFERNAKHFI